MRNITLKLLLCAVLIGVSPVARAQKVYDVRDFGAAGDGTTLDTKAINAAIERCYAAGGGIVLFPTGHTFLSGSIRLQSGIEYRIEQGAILKGAPNGVGAYDPIEENPWADYQDFGHTYYHNSLLWGEGLRDVVFTGGGEINGGGISRSKTEPGDGNKAIAIKSSQNITFDNITIRQGGWFAVILNGCREVVFEGVVIDTPRDGIDLMSCSDVRITQCSIRSVRDTDGRSEGGDDAIGIKSDYALGRTISSENIVIRNCFISAGCNAIQFGSETAGDFRNIRVENCVIEGADKAGIGITSNDGAVIENITYKNIVMTRVATPVFMYVSDRMRTPDRTQIGKIRNITIENVAAFDCYGYLKDEAYTATISGHPQSAIENIRISNLSIIYKGGGERIPLVLPQNAPDQYAPRGLGVRPASGFYIRNAKNITLENVSIGFEKPDLRPPLVFDHVEGITVTEPNIASASNVDVELLSTQGFRQSGARPLRTHVNP